MNESFPVTKFLRWAVLGVAITFILYALAVIVLTWPISSWSVDKAGVFGDSFGFLTSLFTGLAFAGLLSTIFLQREELRLNRQEIKETKEEFKLQSQTFHRQRFEDAFYQMLSLYKENLRDLSIRPHNQNTSRIHGIDALNHLNYKFDKAWAKHKRPVLPDNEDERTEYLYVLSSTVHSVYVRQTRYVETLSNILLLVEDECIPKERQANYWRIIASQLTAYEIKYLFYQAFITPELLPLRNIIQQSTVLQDRISMLGIPNSHRKAFEVIWGIAIPKKKNPFRSPLTKSQIKKVRKSIQDREKEALAHAAACKTLETETPELET
jgi:hypothetical protein